MRISNNILVIGFIFILISCTNNESITIVFESVDGISKESSVLYKGFEVGKVNSISVNDSGLFNVRVKLDNYTIPDKSVFVAYSTSLLGPKAIDIRNSETINNYKGIHQHNSITDSITDKAIDFLKYSIDKSQNNDSLLMEIRRLNNNLENINYQNN